MSAALAIRPARPADLGPILALLADDPIARARGDHTAAPGPGVLAAFSRILDDAERDILVGELDGAVVATLQVSALAGLGHGGVPRALIEAVRVRADLRGQGHGEQLVEAALAWARAHGCREVQLTSDRRRGDAQRFYARLGFVASHVGMKRAL